MTEVGRAFSLFFAAPLLTTELVVIAGILLVSWGSALGAPAAFWSERPKTQFIAGLSTNVWAAQTCFLVYLGAEPPVEVRPWVFFCVSLVSWCFVVAVAAVLQQLRAAAFRASGSAQGEATDSGSQWRGRGAPGLRPMIGRGAGERLGDYLSPASPPWMFLLGALAAAIVVVVIARGLLPAARGLEGPQRWIGDAQSCPLIGRGRVAHSDLHVLSAILFAGTALLCSAIVVFRWQVPSATSLCGLLAIVGGVDGFVAFWLHGAGVAFIPAAGLLALAGLQRYKVRVAELKPLYKHPRALDPPGLPAEPLEDSPGSPEDAPLRVDLLSETRLSPVNAGDPRRRIAGYPSGSRHPIVLVCTSGGGIRAATWTAAILARLDRVLQEGGELRKRTWMVTGASGGMVGAAAWVAALRAAPDRRVNWESLLDAVSTDSLSSTILALTLGDVPRTIVPFPNRMDRGTLLQREWSANLRERLAASEKISPDLDEPLVALREDESSGSHPSLVFSPMMVEDGRRLLIGNPRLASATINRVAWVPGPDDTPASISARHARDLLGKDFAKLTLATAARLSASFPYVSPATHMPSAPVRRVVDAGYYDDYGVDLACSWLERCHERNLEWISKHVSGILVIQIRDSETPLSPGVTTQVAPGLADAKPGEHEPGAPRPDTRASTTRSGAGSLGRALQGVTSPLEGVLAARDAAMLFRNDAQLHTTRRLFRASGLPDDFVSTVVFELKSEISLSWAMTDAERAIIRSQAGSQAVQRKMLCVRQWLAQRATGPSESLHPSSLPAL